MAGKKCMRGGAGRYDCHEAMLPSWITSIRHGCRAGRDSTDFAVSDSCPSASSAILRFAGRPTYSQDRISRGQRPIQAANCVSGTV